MFKHLPFHYNWLRRITCKVHVLGASPNRSGQPRHSPKQQNNLRPDRRLYIFLSWYAVIEIIKLQISNSCNRFSSGKFFTRMVKLNIRKDFYLIFQDVQTTTLWFILIRVKYLNKIMVNNVLHWLYPRLKL